MEFIDGGVTAPQGFYANGIRSGIKASRTKEDTALVVSQIPCVAAGVFTKNLVKAETVKLTRKRIENHRAQAFIVNVGYANACTGEEGAKVALREAKAAKEALVRFAQNGSVLEDGQKPQWQNLEEDDVFVCSTGVIGQQVPVQIIEDHIDELASGLSKKGHEKARIAIMTTDTKYKECAVRTTIGGKTVTIGTMAKGSGMIHINMGTMLGFITTDCAINAEMLEKALRSSIEGTYNCVSVDGDTSTNDTLVILANGLAGNEEITGPGADFDAFLEALNALNTKIARKIAADGEGAEHLLECTVTGAKDTETARALAKSVISSSLVKAAFFGKDANWGRILCAMGYSGQFFSPEKCSVSFKSAASGGMMVKVCDHGADVAFDEDKAKILLSEEEVNILIELEDGNASGTAWGCDLTYEYVKINGDYRT